MQNNSRYNKVSFNEFIQFIVFETFIPGGIALTTSATNYAGVLFRLRVTDGTATADSNDCRVWYRNDGTATKETMQLCTTTYIIDASSTTFANNSTVYAYIQFAQITGTGSYATGMCQWGGRRLVRGYQFRKVA